MTGTEAGITRDFERSRDRSNICNPGERTRAAKRSRVLDFLHRVRLKLNVTRAFDGLILVADDEVQLNRVEAALAIIRNSDPIRYRRLLRDLACIWVGYGAEPIGAYYSQHQLCALALPFVLSEDTTPGLLASVIVHEATHARLRRMGFDRYEDYCAKEEGICLRRELAFASKVPGGIPGLWAQANLENPLDYCDDAVRARNVDEIRTRLAEIGCPRWLIAVLARFGEILSRARMVGRARAEGPDQA